MNKVKFCIFKVFGNSTFAFHPWFFLFFFFCFICVTGFFDLTGLTEKSSFTDIEIWVYSFTGPKHYKEEFKDIYVSGGENRHST